MIKSSCLTQQQIHETIMKHLFGELNLQEFISNKISTNCNITRESIIDALSKKIREFILDLQKSLLMAQKIKQLRIYDHDHISLFEPILLHLRQIISESCKQQFFHLYKNINLNWIEIIWQMQYTFIHTQKRLQIYNSFMDFIQKQDLFKKIRLQQRDPTQGNFPYQSVGRLFPLRDLQLILKIFKEKKDALKTYRRLKDLQLNGPEYKDQRQFIVRFDNLLLIGLYTSYKQYCFVKSIQYEFWDKFIQRKFKNINFEPHIYTLLRISIRNDANIQQLTRLYELILPKNAPKPKQPDFNELHYIIEQQKNERNIESIRQKQLEMNYLQPKTKKRVKLTTYQ